ncbi:MAG: hypothetical protein IPF62_14455 [Bacteroidetes bacterium]|nr:hypothetical protein [Bacteroidota bacterium]
MQIYVQALQASTITEPTLLTVSMSNIIDATCNGLCNGSAQATGLVWYQSIILYDYGTWC